MTNSINETTLNDLRLKIKDIFDRYLKLNGLDRKYNSNFNSNLKNYEELSCSFRSLIGKEIGCSTLRKLFYYKNQKKFSKYYFDAFKEYVSKNESLKENKLECKKILNSEYNKWLNNIEKDYVEHHYFMPKDIFNNLIDFCQKNKNDINRNELIFFFINAVYYGDISIHNYINDFYNDKKLIRYLVFLVMSNWIRVSWRAAYIISKLNKDKTKEIIEQIKTNNNEHKLLFDVIIDDSVINFLENIVNKASNDMNTISYANQVLRLIKNRTNVVKLFDKNTFSDI
ncbi:MAG: hypothetical protein WCO13_06215 [Bacteroidota bacterium]